MSLDGCVFCKIISGEIPSNTVFENDHLLAFRDINPCAPTHILVIPKSHIQDLNSPCQQVILGELLSSVPIIAKQENISSYRTVINTGSDAGQTVFHLHLHIIAGRKLSWPPG